MTFRLRGRDLYGRSVCSGDEIVGVVRDLLFDHRDWTVRYLVVETGAWPSPRRVLLVPGNLQGVHAETAPLCTSLSAIQVADCPLASTHPPADQEYARRLMEQSATMLHWADDAPPVEPGRDTNPLESAQAIRCYRVARPPAGAGLVVDVLMQTPQEQFAPTVESLVIRGRLFWWRRWHLPVDREVQICHASRRIFMLGRPPFRADRRAFA